MPKDLHFRRVLLFPYKRVRGKSVLTDFPLTINLGHIKDVLRSQSFKSSYPIMKKIQGQEIVAVDEGTNATVIDLMEALQKSLELSKNKDEQSQKKLTGTA